MYKMGERGKRFAVLKKDLKKQKSVNFLKKFTKKTSKTKKDKK